MQETTRQTSRGAWRGRGSSMAGGLALFALLAVGCSENPNDPALSDNSDNNAEFGGFTTVDEAPGFGDPVMVSMAADLSGEAVNDVTLQTDPQVVEMDTDPETGRFALKVIWGKPRYDSTVGVATDWTGSLSISRGAEVVRRVIRFERGQDELLPRADRKLIEWVSQTTVHNDGLLVEIFNPPHPDSIRIDTTFITDPTGNEIVGVIDTTVFTSPLTLTFRTAPLTISFSADQLAALDTVIYVQDSCAVIFQSTRIERHPCPRGYLAGGWGVTDSGEQVFRGVWMSVRGNLEGYLRGRWGVNDAGRRMFWGKWISSNGRFEGFLRGTWAVFNEPSDLTSNSDRVVGGFKGGIFDASRMPIGMLRGHFWSHNRDETIDTPLRGRLEGKWTLACAGRPGLGADGEVIVADGEF
ncbi:MAG: hypothetical protein ACE5GA_05295 [Candidatus Zixiibacteriota bacterium]